MWHGEAMGFFDEAIAAANERARAEAAEWAVPRVPEPWERDERAIPAAVANDGLIWLGDDSVAAVTAVGALPNGFEFTISQRRRVQWRPGTRPWRSQPDQLDVRVVLADGRVLRSGDELGADVWATRLEALGGSSSNTASDMRYWVGPLPENGPLTLVLDWADEGQMGLRFEFDVPAIRQAAARSPRLWGDR